MKLVREQEHFVAFAINVHGRHLELGDAHPHTLESWNNLIELCEAWNKPEEAKEWRVKLPQAEAAGEWHTSSNGPISLTYKTSEFLEKSCHRFVSTDLDFSQLELKWTSTLGLKPKIL